MSQTLNSTTRTRLSDLSTGSLGTLPLPQGVSDLNKEELRLIEGGMMMEDITNAIGWALTLGALGDMHRNPR